MQGLFRQGRLGGAGAGGRGGRRGQGPPPERPAPLPPAGPGDVQRLAEDANAFAFEAFKHLGRAGENLVFSPGSLHATLAMAGPGATGGAAPRPKGFKADHPFVFLIQARQTGLILFLGPTLCP